MAERFELIFAERRALLELFEGVHGDQWSQPSLCPGWSVHDVLAHLASALDASTALSVRLVVASLGRPKVLIDKLTSHYASQTSEKLLATYRRHVDSDFAPPGMGWKASLTDVMVHRMDVAVPLGIDPQRPPESWRPVLEFLTSGIPMLGSIRRRRPEVTWHATDLGWSHGSGPEVAGTAAAIGTTMAGRAALLEGLSGPGRESLATWVG